MLGGVTELSYRGERGDWLYQLRNEEQGNRGGGATEAKLIRLKIGSKDCEEKDREARGESTGREISPIKFIIKTMTKGELDLMLGMLPSLAEHYNRVPDSLIMKVFGVFTVKTS